MNEHGRVYEVLVVFPDLAIKININPAIAVTTLNLLEYKSGGLTL